MCLDCACGRTDQASERMEPPHRHPAAVAEQPAPITPVAVKPPAPLQSLSVGLRLLAHNDRQAEANRARVAVAGVRVVNILSAPGSGKTALLEALARHAAAAAHPLAMAVLVGDLATELDAERLRAAGLAAVPITTGQACHLEAAMVARGVDALEAAGHGLAGLDLLLIENVGNLVCPAAYDLGEDLRLVLLSVSEGEDKPLKYPATFHGADVVVISKSDLAAAVDFARERVLANIQAVAPGARVVEVSARSGAGLEAVLQLLR
jgi:hydrogenase nickel incorporation protein HypB